MLLLCSQRCVSLMEVPSSREELRPVASQNREDWGSVEVGMVWPQRLDGEYFSPPLLLGKIPRWAYSGCEKVAAPVI